jgi:hypothetical protein
MSFKVTIVVTQKELDDAQYGSISDLQQLGFRVIEEATKQGYKGSME